MHDQRSATTGDGRRLTYTVVGRGPLLLCHPGGPGFGGSYFQDLGGLVDTRTLVLLDPAGTGGSDPWREDAYSLAGAAADVDDLRAELGEERIDYLGHSAGGFVGIRWAALYPQSVRRLLLVGTFPRFTDELRAALGQQARLHEREPWYEDALHASAERAARNYASDDEFDALYMSGFRFYFARYGKAEQAFVERLDSGCDRRTLESFNDQVASLDLRPDLPHIEAQTLIVNGELDATRAGEQELLDGISNARLAIVKDAAHFPWVEQPARFRDPVLPFLTW
jgi:pimeloyl-ACP methyl ester carboxylesterase